MNFDKLISSQNILEKKFPNWSEFKKNFFPKILFKSIHRIPKKYIWWRNRRKIIEICFDPVLKTKPLLLKTFQIKALLPQRKIFWERGYFWDMISGRRLILWPTFSSRCEIPCFFKSFLKKKSEWQTEKF